MTALMAAAAQTRCWAAWATTAWPAGAAADSIQGGGGADSIQGGSGDDVLLGDGDLSTPGSTININASNFSDTSSGFTVTARNVVSDGGGGFTLSSSSVSNVSTFDGGIGATGNISDSDSSVQQQVGFDKASGLSEELSIAFDQDIEELIFQFSVLFTGSFAEIGNYALYNGGVLVHEAGFTEQGAGSGSGQIDVTGHGLFDEIVFTGKLQGDGTDGSDFIISDVEFTAPDTTAAGGGDTVDGGLGADSILGEVVQILCSVAQIMILSTAVLGMTQLIGRIRRRSAFRRRWRRQPHNRFWQ